MSLKELNNFWLANRAKITKQDFLGKEYASSLLARVRKEMTADHPIMIQHLLLSLERKIAMLSHEMDTVILKKKEEEEPLDISPIANRPSIPQPMMEEKKPDKKEQLIEVLQNMLKKVRES